jgi:hypothetical protein
MSDSAPKAGRFLVYARARAYTAENSCAVRKRDVFQLQENGFLG